MKKALFFVSAIACMSLFASCEKEEIGQVAENGNVTFTLQAPQDIVTRTIGDGENVNVVYYEIYKAGSGHKNSIEGATVPLIEGTVPMDNKEAVLSLNLLEDQNYVALFWAQVDGKSYYNVNDLRNVEVNYANLKSNDESRAAFCGRLPFNTSEDVKTEVTLERPFAQLNMGTTFESLKVAYDLDITKSKVIVTSPARFFNVNTGIGHTATDAPVEFALEEDPQETLYVEEAGYKYIAMNYFVVDGNKANVDVDFDIVTNIGTVSKEVTQIPVQKNYRTNILGNLLTKETSIEIVVDKGFITPSLDIYLPLREGGVLKLQEDIILNSECPLVVTAGPNKPVTIDLNGFDIDCKEGTVYVQGKVSSLISVQNGSVVTIKGNGTVYPSNNEDYAVEVRDGVLNIESGNFIGAYTAAYAVKGEINIKGGRFSNGLGGDNRYVLNLLGGADDAKIIVTGGTFVGFNPQDNAAENPKVNFVAPGYKSVDNGDGTWTVIPE